MLTRYFCTIKTRLIQVLNWFNRIYLFYGSNNFEFQGILLKFSLRFFLLGSYLTSIINSYIPYPKQNEYMNSSQLTLLLSFYFSEMFILTMLLIFFEKQQSLLLPDFFFKYKVLKTSHLPRKSLTLNFKRTVIDIHIIGDLLVS